MKRLHWMGRCLKDVKSFPEDVRREVGFSILMAQKGSKAVNAIPLVGFGSSKVLEVVIDDDGSTYRAVYTVKFGQAVYALHAFQKKSKKGIQTPRSEMELVRSRLKLAEAHYELHYARTKKKDAAG